ncbi:hypothetical protein Hanom_Chr03g00205191 [Helianthus anomalus]
MPKKIHEGDPNGSELKKNSETKTYRGFVGGLSERNSSTATMPSLADDQSREREGRGCCECLARVRLRLPVEKLEGEGRGSWMLCAQGFQHFNRG